MNSSSPRSYIKFTRGWTYLLDSILNHVSLFSLGIRSLRSIVTSFQVTSFHLTVTSFQKIVTSFHKQIVGNYKVVMLCCCAILIANTTCLDMLFKLTFLSIKLYSSTVIFIVGRFVADRSCLTFFKCLHAMCENFLSPAPK